MAVKGRVPGSTRQRGRPERRPRQHASLAAGEAALGGVAAVLAGEEDAANDDSDDGLPLYGYIAAGQPIEATNPTTFRNGRAFVGRWGSKAKNRRSDVAAAPPELGGEGSAHVQRARGQGGR